MFLLIKKRLLLTLSSLVFTVAVHAENTSIDCENALSTLQINQCASIELESAKAELLNYLDASFQHHANDPELVKAIKVAQENWQAYMSSHCDSIYTQWRAGTIRGVMAISCKTKLTKQRTHEIWTNFLTYMDDAPPVLPEPKH
ncbi:Uncharacterized conserved protein YecT, DUF1311 family [Allopseudospirillum japonicum]|uniref:Uncharacterized conserved protein YecT, DUF1311 family n=1 Tax=Allopseudospirillum japonicum TaxID=64971 RepID=A0A1H6U4I9_9GAMM|nr:lysozyme inhibitor LprI family protein [Allopseudospirillum japonicum]SEI87278.1 Uncharacterized conserved protein YecT, DUF1311 family [Allopseudospirillum japonicum]